MTALSSNNPYSNWVSSFPPAAKNRFADLARLRTTLGKIAYIPADERHLPEGSSGDFSLAAAFYQDKTGTRLGAFSIYKPLDSSQVVAMVQSMIEAKIISDHDFSLRKNLGRHGSMTLTFRDESGVQQTRKRLKATDFSPVADQSNYDLYGMDSIKSVYNNLMKLAGHDLEIPKRTGEYQALVGALNRFAANHPSCKAPLAITNLLTFSAEFKNQLSAQNVPQLMLAIECLHEQGLFGKEEVYAIADGDKARLVVSRADGLRVSDAKTIQELGRPKKLDPLAKSPVGLQAMEALFHNAKSLVADLLKNPVTDNTGLFAGTYRLKSIGADGIKPKPRPKKSDFEMLLDEQVWNNRDRDLRSNSGYDGYSRDPYGDNSYGYGYGVRSYGSRSSYRGF